MHKRFPDGLPPLDPIKDMKIDDADFVANVKKLESLEQRCANHPLRKNANFVNINDQYKAKLEVCEILRIYI